MAKATITKDEALMLEGLAALAKRHAKTVQECERAMDEICGFDPDNAETSDLVYGDRDVRWLLEANKIEVEDGA